VNYSTGTDLVHAATLPVPGATLYYETRGAGPTLLLIPGGPQDAGVFSGLAQHLAGRYTVVAYDPRGNSRSTVDGPPQDLQLDVQGDDAARLIEAIGNEPAYVFGTSGGAQIGLNLAARHPRRVQSLLAHEPPCLLLLDDPAPAIAADQEIYDTYRREGVDAAMATFMAMSGLEGGPEEMDFPSDALPPEAMATFARIEGNFEYWLAHGMMPLSLYRPDVDDLRRGQPRILIGVGEASHGQIAAETGLALAKKLGTAPVSFPGDHVGFEAHADTFAERLHRAFSDA
jgi:pimeloyl-ACP methyl ester carboxylesterase